MDIQLGWFALGIYAASFVFFLVTFLERRRGHSLSGIVILAIALAVHLAATVIRAKLAGHLPFASRFEALTFYALVTAGLTLVIGIIRRDLPVAFLTPAAGDALHGRRAGRESQGAARPAAGAEQPVLSGSRSHRLHRLRGIHHEPGTCHRRAVRPWSRKLQTRRKSQAASPRGWARWRNCSDLRANSCPGAC